MNGDICTICCATERENSVDCPLHCEYLHDAHRHESTTRVDPASVPNGDIRVTEQFLQDNELLMAFLAVTLFEAAAQTAATTDWDLREALEALITTYRAGQSGIYYENRPLNALAARLVSSVQEKIAEIRKKEKDAAVTGLRDADILGVLVFLQRLEYSNNNKRKRSKAFLDLLRGFYLPAEMTQPAEAEPEAPRIIL